MLMRHIKIHTVQTTVDSVLGGTRQRSAGLLEMVRAAITKGERAASFNRLLHAAARSIAPSLAMVQRW